MALEIVAARNINHAFDIVSITRMKNGVVICVSLLIRFL